jgi:hypothetical protein
MTSVKSSEAFWLVTFFVEKQSFSLISQSVRVHSSPDDKMRTKEHWPFRCLACLLPLIEYLPEIEILAKCQNLYFRQVLCVAHPVVESNRLFRVERPKQTTSMSLLHVKFIFCLRFCFPYLLVISINHHWKSRSSMSRFKHD